MPMTQLQKLLVAAEFSALLSTCSASYGSRPPTLVEVWRGGDDALTTKFADAIERGFSQSSAFTPSTGRKPHTLIVTIPTNVTWKQVRNRTQVLYTVNFSSDDSQSLGTSSGACWAHVIKDAKAGGSPLTREMILTLSLFLGWPTLHGFYEGWATLRLVLFHGYR
jgi:hypothetical protein